MAAGGTGDLAELAGEQPGQQRDRVVLVAEVDGDDPLPGHVPRPLEAGDGLADAGLAPDEEHLAGTDATGQHLVERAEPGGARWSRTGRRSWPRAARPGW